MRERRNFHRILQPIPARYRVKGSLAASWVSATLVNISASGLRFRSEELLEKGALVEFEAQVPGLRETLCLKGTVVWVSYQASGVIEMGVQFSEATLKQQYQIDNFVSFLRSSGTQRALPPNPS